MWRAYHSLFHRRIKAYFFSAQARSRLRGRSQSLFCFIHHSSFMPKENQTSAMLDVQSNWKGSENTRQKVAEQIRQRFGEEAAAAYSPLTNYLTWNLWLKNGYRVKKGEKAMRSVTLVEQKDATGNVIRRYPKTVFLFYHLQVEPIRPPTDPSCVPVYARPCSS